MFMMILAVVGGIFLTVILGFVVWVAAFRQDDRTWSIADGPQRLHRGEAEARGDYVGGSGRAPGDYVGIFPFW